MLTREYYPLIRIFRVHHKWVRGRALRALEEHRRIVDAIIDRDAELAELLMRRHVSASKANMQKVLTAVEERSEEHTSELQSLMRNSYAVFYVIKKHKQNPYIKAQITMNKRETD